MVSAMVLSGQAFACGIQGSAVNSDGSKIDGSGTSQYQLEQ